MIEKFDSFEEASLFVQNKQAEGFEAAIVNESVGFLWGPRVVGGFRVEVGEKREPREEGSAPETESDSFASRSVRGAVALIMVVGAGVAMLTAALALPQVLGLSVVSLWSSASAWLPVFSCFAMISGGEGSEGYYRP